MRRGEALRVVIVVILPLLGTSGCGSSASAPARITAGAADTVVVNNVRAVHVPVQVFDAAGHALSDSSVRYTWQAGEPMAVSALGTVVCSHRGDATIRATLRQLSTRIVVRCRPVAAVRFPGSLELVLGDSAQPIPFAAYGPDNRPVDIVAARVWVRDSGVVALNGVRVQGRMQGTTLISITIGDQGATSGVRVYERTTTLDGLKTERRLVALPLRLARGSMQRWSLPPGGWILSVLPPEKDGAGIQLRVEGARCDMLQGFGPRRYGCVSNQMASVVVYAPWRAGSTEVLTGTLAVKPDAETIHPLAATHGYPRS